MSDLGALLFGGKFGKIGGRTSSRKGSQSSQASSRNISKPTLITNNLSSPFPSMPTFSLKPTPSLAPSPLPNNSFSTTGNHLLPSIGASPSARLPRTDSRSSTPSKSAQYATYDYGFPAARGGAASASFSGSLPYQSNSLPNPSPLGTSPSPGGFDYGQRRPSLPTLTPSSSDTSVDSLGGMLVTPSNSTRVGPPRTAKGPSNDGGLASVSTNLTSDAYDSMSKGSPTDPFLVNALPPVKPSQRLYSDVTPTAQPALPSKPALSETSSGGAYEYDANARKNILAAIDAKESLSNSNSSSQTAVPRSKGSNTSLASATATSSSGHGNPTSVLGGYDLTRRRPSLPTHERNDSTSSLDSFHNPRKAPVPPKTKTSVDTTFMAPKISGYASSSTATLAASNSTMMPSPIALPTAPSISPISPPPRTPIPAVPADLSSGSEKPKPILPSLPMSSAATTSPSKTLPSRNPTAESNYTNWNTWAGKNGSSSSLVEKKGILKPARPVNPTYNPYSAPGANGSNTSLVATPRKGSNASEQENWDRIDESEFTMVVPGPKTPADVRQAAHRIAQASRQPPHPPAQPHLQQPVKRNESLTSKFPLPPSTAQFTQFTSTGLPIIPSGPSSVPPPPRRPSAASETGQSYGLQSKSQSLRKPPPSSHAVMDSFLPSFDDGDTFVPVKQTYHSTINRSKSAAAPTSHRPLAAHV